MPPGRSSSSLGSSLPPLGLARELRGAGMAHLGLAQQNLLHSVPRQLKDADSLSTPALRTVVRSHAGQVFCADGIRLGSANRIETTQ